MLRGARGWDQPASVHHADILLALRSDQKRAVIPKMGPWIVMSKL